MPIEMHLARVTARFGAQAVYSGQIPAADGLGIMWAEKAESVWRGWKGYRDKDGNENWAEWSEKYPDDARMIMEYLANGK